MTLRLVNMQLQHLFIFTFISFCIIQNVSAQGSDNGDNDCDGKTQAQNTTKKPFKLRGPLGGTDVKPHFFPATVIMMVGGYFGCGATILNEEWVLSAASCVNSTGPNDYSFSAGRHDMRKQEDSEQKVSAVAVFVHEGYTKNFKNDIVLFKVSPKFTFNDQVKATLLAPKDWNRKGMAWVVGWSITAQHKCSNRLQKVGLPIVPNDKCENLMGNIYDTNICAGSLNGGKDSCQGDLGSPMYYKDKLSWIQVGIVSWGDGCGKKGMVGVYTRISKYLDWIQDKTGINLS